MKDFSLLEAKLNIFFKNKKLLTEAFCHRSFLNEHPELKINHNERLEFLGDSVLELIVTEHLFFEFPDKSEGELSSYRAALVNAKMLANIAKNLGFEEFLLLSKGEQKGDQKARMYILANTFEAFVGALYLDQGLQKTKSFIFQHLLTKLEEIIEKKLYKNPKSRLQEEAQERLKVTPVYKVLKEWGPDHAKKFIVGVFFNENLVATGEGSSKQEAEEAAAQNALKVQNW